MTFDQFDIPNLVDRIAMHAHRPAPFSAWIDNESNIASRLATNHPSIKDRAKTTPARNPEQTAQVGNFFVDPEPAPDDAPHELDEVLPISPSGEDRDPVSYCLRSCRQSGPLNHMITQALGAPKTIIDAFGHERQVHTRYTGGYNAA